MKLQLDTTNKTVKVEETVGLEEFMKVLERLLPDGKWKKFNLETQTVINWSNPVVIEPYTPPHWQQPWITYDTRGTDANKYSIKDGVYNVEV